MQTEQIDKQTTFVELDNIMPGQCIHVEAGSITLSSCQEKFTNNQLLFCGAQVCDQSHYCEKHQDKEETAA